MSGGARACWDVASAVNGWLTRREAEFLYEAARAVPRGGRIVEIGSFFGRSTLCLAFGSRDGNQAPILAVDPHYGSPKHERMIGCADTYPSFVANLEAAGVGALVEPVHATSERAAAECEGPLDLIFVDGSHELLAVRTDFERWFPKLRDGGTIAFHDSWHMSGVRRVTTGLLAAPCELASPRLVDTITACVKRTGSRNRHRAFVWLRRLRAPLGFLRLTYRGTRLVDARAAHAELLARLGRAPR